MSGKSHKMGLPETRGRKRKLTRKQVLKLNTVRKTLLKKADGQTKVTYSQILRKGRLAMNVSPTTLAKNFQTEGVDVKWRPAREGQVLDGKAKAERMAICNKWKFLASDYFPTQNAAFKSLKRGKVRGHLRTRPEGTTDHCKRPHPRKNRVNPGGSVTVCAAIIAGKLRMWHYLDKGKWNGAVAASMYKGPLLKALRRCHGELPRYIILEDNDPSGFKSRKGETAKIFPRLEPFGFLCVGCCGRENHFQAEGANFRVQVSAFADCSCPGHEGRDHPGCCGIYKRQG